MRKCVRLTKEVRPVDSSGSARREPSVGSFPGASFTGALLLFLSNAAQAGDCSPGSPIYEDRFFRYCDEQRKAYEEATVKSDATQRTGAHQIKKAPAVASTSEAAPAAKTKKEE